jgi:hypothetical protein
MNATRLEVAKVVLDTIAQVTGNTLIFLIAYFLWPQDTRAIPLLIYLFRLFHYLSDGHEQMMWLARFQEVI